MTSEDLPLVDLIVLGVLAIAVFRGIWIGLIREGASLAAIGIATIVTRLFAVPFGGAISGLTGGGVAGKTAVFIAGVILVVGTIVALSLLARAARRGAAAAGLGWADRLGGGALGAAEGAIIAAVIVLIALWLVGPKHATTDGSRSVEVVERLQSMHERGELPAVASPGNWLGASPGIAR